MQAIEQYQVWLEIHDMGSPEAKETILNMVQSLASDRVTLAFAAEFSRGKTELINAMFFSDTGLRLLPSTPGRTTMCPTELFYDSEGGSYIRLLSIDTRLNEMSLTEYKDIPDSWMQIDLDCSSAIQMQEAFQELVSVKTVSLDDAKKLGLYHEDMHPGQDTPPDTVEIPCWRHALISFPHYLLKEGLVILDTPGLNALGTEPELTLNMLPNAQAVIFVLAADTGVTKSDLDMWRHHVRGFRAKNKKGLAVVMNKIDTLWDDLQGDEGIEKSIKSQISSTASILEIDESVIFPVSAKQALLAKVKSDDSLLEKSRLHALEVYLSEQVLDERRNILVESVSETIGRLVTESSKVLDIQVASLNKQLEDLRGMEGVNEAMTERLMEEAREEQSRYLANMENFQASRRVFDVQVKRLVGGLAAQAVDEIINNTRKQMAGSLTTIGMKTVMKKVFDDLKGTLDNAIEMTEETRRLVKAIYKKFVEEHGFKEISPPLFSITKYQLELGQIFKEGEDFRTSTSSTLMEQGLVIQKLYSSVVSRARDVLIGAYKDANSWSAVVLNPLIRQIKEHKKLIETRLQMLRDVNENAEDVAAKIKKYQSQLLPTQKQHDELSKIVAAMDLGMNINLPIEEPKDQKTKGQKKKESMAAAS